MREIKFRAWHKEENKMIYPESGMVMEWIRGQFTGLKDRNGKEIYEGDIVNTAPYVDCIKKRMKIDTYWKKVEFYKDRIIPFDYTEEYGSPAEECEVIGNIYENPELLKEGKMKKKGKRIEIEYEKYVELFPQTVLGHMERMFKKSYREGYYLLDMVFLPNEKKWLFKFKKKLNPLQKRREEK